MRIPTRRRSAGYKPVLRLCLFAALLLGLVPAAEAHSLKWWEQHLYYRLGYSRILIKGDSSPVVLSDLSPTASLSVQPGPIPDSGANFRSITKPMGIIGFILPWFGGHFSVEAMLTSPLKFEFDFTGNAATQSLGPNAINVGALASNLPTLYNLLPPSLQNLGVIPTGIPPLGHKIGSFNALPPVLTLVYHPGTFRPLPFLRVRPYIGAGVAWLMTYNKDITNPTLTNPEATAKYGQPQLTLSRPFACVGQAGLDIGLPAGFYLTADARYIGCADVQAEMHNISVVSPTLSPFIGPIQVGNATSTIHIKILAVSLLIGTTFWGE